MEDFLTEHKFHFIEMHVRRLHDEEYIYNKCCHKYRICHDVRVLRTEHHSEDYRTDKEKYHISAASHRTDRSYSYERTLFR